MANGLDMNRMTSLEQRADEALVDALEQMLAELAGVTAGGDVGWVRPLAVLSAEIEYSALRSSRVDSIGLAHECRELVDLLAGSPGAGGQFASRYAAAHQASPAIAALHDRVLAACQTVTRRHALAPWAT
jgi:hypothetical protein